MLQAEAALQSNKQTAAMHAAQREAARAVAEAARYKTMHSDAQVSPARLCAALHGVRCLRMCARIIYMFYLSIFILPPGSERLAIAISRKRQGVRPIFEARIVIYVENWV